MQTAAPVLLLGGAAVASCVLLLMLRRRRGGAEALSPPSDTQNTQNKQHALSPPSDTQDKQSKRAAKKRRKQAAAADAQSTAATAQVPASTPTVVGSFTVAAGGQTLGELLCSQLPREFPSRGAAKRLLGRGQVLLDGDPADGDATVPACGQLVEYVMMPRPRVHQAHNSGGGPPSLHLEWAHVDDHLAVCVKPQGVAVQGDQSACKLRHAVGWELPPPNHLPDPLAVARFVHRIDKATGGLLVLARTGAACTSARTPTLVVRCCTAADRAGFESVRGQASHSRRPLPTMRATAAARRWRRRTSRWWRGSLRVRVWWTRPYRASVPSLAG
jgi:hypothetical protein